jgi:hypothetical protein
MKWNGQGCLPERFANFEAATFRLSLRTLFGPVAAKDQQIIATAPLDPPPSSEPTSIANRVEGPPARPDPDLRIDPNSGPCSASPLVNGFDIDLSRGPEIEIRSYEYLDSDELR